MLSDSQIERYARQIVLPECGGRGQEALLAATVAVRGGGEAVQTCAAYLASAGVGELLLDEASLGAGLEARNPDCRVTASRALTAGLEIRIGGADDALERIAVPLLAGRAGPLAFALAAFAAAGGCTACWRAATAPLRAGEAAAGPGPRMLGTVLAVEALRALLGLGGGEARLLEMDLRDTECRTAPFPYVAGCAVCGKERSK